MKLLLLFVLIFSQTVSKAGVPGDNYQGRLYRLCKVWGFLKYYHSRVSQCQVNWDSVLVATIPLVKAATDRNNFNNALLQMLDAAGPMDSATTHTPVLDSSTAINVDTTWLNDPYFSDSVRLILNNIQRNFRPHASCYVENNDYTDPDIASWLVFPGDSAFSDTISVFPSEILRLQMLFRYWNILNYFNPNSRIIDISWDTILLNNILNIDTAYDSLSFYNGMLKIIAGLDDAHAFGSYSFTMGYPTLYYPPIVLSYIDSSYVVIVSGNGLFNKGDIILSINSLSTAQWEDSLKPYISASNSASFRRWMSFMMLSGVYNSDVHIVSQDSAGNERSIDIERNDSYYDWLTLYYTENNNIKWETIGCNIGYVNMENIQNSDLEYMYDSMANKSAIIFDLRNYPVANMYVLGALMFPHVMPVAKSLLPDITYPGNFYITFDSAGLYDSTGNWINNPDPYLGG